MELLDKIPNIISVQDALRNCLPELSSQCNTALVSIFAMIDVRNGEFLRTHYKKFKVLQIDIAMEYLVFVYRLGHSFYRFIAAQYSIKLPEKYFILRIYNILN